MPDDDAVATKTTTEKDRTEFLATARKRFEDSVGDEKNIREQALLDLRFVAGDQWDSAVKTERTSKGRPALTFNRCHTFVQQVSNEARQNKPQIKFVVGDGGDQDTADVKEGIARHIQYASDAQVAYETAVEYSAGGSFGYFRFLPDYVDDESWDQEIKVCPVFDPFSVYGILIPSCFGIEPQYGFVVEEIPTAEYKRIYDTDEIDSVGWDQAERLSEGWIGTETVRVAEYWYIEYEEKKLTRKANGSAETRTVQKPTVKFCKINGMEIIPNTETEWKGYCIPIVPVLGKQMILNGKPLLFSVVRYQRDPQQLINFYKTRIAETMGTAPIQPYIMYEGQIQGHEREWNELNSTMRPFLTVKEVIGQTGQPLLLPQRQVFEPPVTALSEAAAQEIDDMKATSGIFDASLGARSNEQSGLAIQRRQQQSNVTNMHFMDNLERAFKKGGLIIADAMPYYYDSDRMQRILGPDEAPKIVRINAPYRDASGKTKHHKIGGIPTSKSDVLVTMGRAFSSKREESFDMMTSVIQAQPEMMNIAGDVFFQNSDMAGADVVAKRMKRFIQLKTPGLIEEDGSDPAAQAQQLQAQNAQLHQQTKALHAYAQKLETERQGKVIETQAKVEMAATAEQIKLEIVKLQEATKLAVAQISASKDANEGFAEREVKQYQILHDSAHDAATQAADHAHEKDMAQVGHQQALEQQDQAGQQQAALAQQQADNQPEAVSQ